MTAVFEQHGLQFQYPENWQLQQSRSDANALEICLLSPSGAFWSVVAFDRTTSNQDLMEQVIEALDEQYDSLEKVAATDEIAGSTTAGYDVHFYCMDLLVATQLRCLDLGSHSLMLMYQAENREFDEKRLVFQAITTSLLSGLTSESALAINDDAL